MSLFLQYFKGRKKKTYDLINRADGFDDDDERQREEYSINTARPNKEEEEAHRADGTEIVYFSSDVSKQNVIDILKSQRSDLQTFTDETECIDAITSIMNKVFLVIDGTPSATFIEAITKLKQIDSVFVYSSSDDLINAINAHEHTCLINWCENDAALIDTIRKSHEELDKHKQTHILLDKREKATRDLTKEAGSFLFFQIAKDVLKHMPKTEQAKETMLATCRDYYRGNVTELENIADFEKNYQSSQAILWYMRECFLYKLINKALRTEDIDNLYQFRFYIVDLSRELEKKCSQLKEKTKDGLRLYRGTKISLDEAESSRANIGNLISTNGYLSTSSDRSVAYQFATSPIKREGIVKALFEYDVDFNTVKKVVVADVHEFSKFPEEGEVVFDIGTCFQIDACEYSADDDLWIVQVHAIDQGAELAAEYMEYQKQKAMEANVVLMFGNLLLEMGEYQKAERYFNTILSSSNPNEEEIACIYFNFGRTHRLKGEFNLALRSYQTAYDLHMNARPKRVASAGKALNGMGVVYSEQGRLLKAEEYFKHAMKLYRKSIPKKHVDVAGLLINLGTIDCDRRDYEGAASKYLKARKIYDRSLPKGHPTHALPRVNLGNVYLSNGQYQNALTEYATALEIQENSLPSDHLDIARTLHNLAVVHAHGSNLLKAKEYLERAEEIANRTLFQRHPVMSVMRKTKDFLMDKTNDYSFSRV